MSLTRAEMRLACVKSALRAAPTLPGSGCRARDAFCKGATGDRHALPSVPEKGFLNTTEPQESQGLQMGCQETAALIHKSLCGEITRREPFGARKKKINRISH